MSIISKIGTAKRLVKNNLIAKGIFSKKSNKELIIVMYHGIDQKRDTRFNQRFFSANDFRQHLIDFRRHFNVLSPQDLAENRFSASRPNVLLTFDDGYANNYRYALPLLSQYKVPAIFFVTGLNNVEKKILWADAVDIVGHLGKEGSKITFKGHDFQLTHGEFLSSVDKSALPAHVRSSKTSGYDEKDNLLGQLLGIYDFTKNKELDDYWQLMTNDEIRRCAESSVITIGSHGYYHNNLGSLSNEDAVAEVLLSKEYLEDVISIPVTTIGFPDGSYTEQLNDSLQAIGITHQFVVDYRYGDGGKRDFTFDRFGLYPNMGNTRQLLYKMLHQ